MSGQKILWNRAPNSMRFKCLHRHFTATSRHNFSLVLMGSGWRHHRTASSAFRMQRSPGPAFTTPYVQALPILSCLDSNLVWVWRPFGRMALFPVAALILTFLCVLCLWVILALASSLHKPLKDVSRQRSVIAKLRYHCICQLLPIWQLHPWPQLHTLQSRILDLSAWPLYYFCCQIAGTTLLKDIAGWHFHRHMSACSTASLQPCIDR